MNNDPNYEPRTLLAPFEQGPLLGTFLRDTFFGAREFPPTPMIEFDFRRGRRRMAPFVAPIIGGKLMERQGFETRQFRAPRIAPVRALRTPDLEPRMIGENIYQPRTAAERAAELLAEDSMFLDEAITRREEWMCREVMVNGNLTITADRGYQMVVDYLESAAGEVSNHELVATKWDANGSDPLDDLERARLSMIRESGIAPNVALFGGAARKAFINNASVQTFLHNRRFFLGNIQPVIESDQVIQFGTVPGLELYEYSEYFEDDAGTLFPMLPDNLVLLASTRIQNKIVYGAFTQLEDVKTKRFVTYQTARIPFVYGDEEDGQLFYRLTACPLPMPMDIMGFRLVEALAGSAGPFGLKRRGAERPYFKPNPEDDKAETEELQSHSVEELKKIAGDEEIDLSGASRKDDIVQTIKEGRKSK